MEIIGQPTFPSIPVMKTLSLSQRESVCVCVCVRVTYQHNLFLKIPKLLPLCKATDSFLGIQEFFPVQCSTIQELKCLNVCLIDIRMF